MGRGRAKAKQTKVARDLKYNTQHTDLGRLQQELSSAPRSLLPTSEDPGPAGLDDGDELEDPYADVYGDDEGDESAVATR